MKKTSPVMNYFIEWKTVFNNTWFTTRSPHPEQDYFFSKDGLLMCENSPSYLSGNIEMDNVHKYIMEQAAIIKFNNSSFKNHQIKTAIKERIIHWKGNETVKKYLNENNVDKIITKAVNEIFVSDDLSIFIEFEFKHHWYSDYIEKLPSHRHGNPWGAKAKAKSEARKKFSADAIVEDIKSESLHYQLNNYNILPTVKYLEGATGYSGPTIRKHGKKYFISQSENKMERVNQYIYLYKNLTHEELSEIVDIPLRTIRRYSVKK